MSHKVLTKLILRQNRTGLQLDAFIETGASQEDICAIRNLK